MIQILDNTLELETKLASLNQKAEDIIILVKNLIEHNSTETLIKISSKRNMIYTIQNIKKLFAKQEKLDLNIKGESSIEILTCIH